MNSLGESREPGVRGSAAVVSEAHRGKTWPFARQSPIEQPRRFDEFRAAEGLVEISLYDGRDVTLATRFDDVKQILMSDAVSSDGSNPEFPSMSDSAKVGRAARRALDRMDPPRHDEHRRMLAPEFTFRRMKEMRPYIEELVDEMLDEMERRGGPVDLVEHLAEPLPAAAIARLLGLPVEDGDFFHDRVKKWMAETSTPAEVDAANTDIINYFERVIDDRAASEPGLDLASRLVHERMLTGELTREELLAMLHLLVSAGYDTSANMIALGTIVLLERGKWQELVDGDEDLVATAVEEILRFVSVAHHAAFRLTTAPLVVAGQLVPAGTRIIASTAAANHDPAHFPSPNDVDLRRSARDHLAFGAGLHQCLGQTLARIELRVVFEKLPKRFPGLRLAVPADALHYRRSLVYGVESVPVIW